MNIRNNLHRPDYDFILLFNKATGSDRIYYFMLDPRSKDRMFPKMCTVIFHKLRNLTGYRPVVLNGMLYIIGGKDWLTGEMSGSTWRYNPDTGKWHQCARMIESRSRFTANILDEKIFVTGKFVTQSLFINKRLVYRDAHSPPPTSFMNTIINVLVKITA